MELQRQDRAGVYVLASPQTRNLNKREDAVTRWKPQMFALQQEEGISQNSV